MNSLDMVWAGSNTERSQYKHSELKQCARYKKTQNRTAEEDRREFKETRDGEAREEPIAAPHASNR
jgi:hypothetical protein